MFLILQPRFYCVLFCFSISLECITWYKESKGLDRQITLIKIRDLSSIKFQLTLEQHGFELHGLTFIQIFSALHTRIINKLQLMEFTDLEPCIWRNCMWKANYKLQLDFGLQNYRKFISSQNLFPHPCATQGSTVTSCMQMTMWHSKAARALGLQYNLLGSHSGHG